MGGKWLELLKEIVPGLGGLRSFSTRKPAKGRTSYLHSVETAAPLFSVEATALRFTKVATSNLR